MPQIDIRLNSSANVGGFNQTSVASQNLQRNLAQLARGMDQVINAFKPERIVQSFLGGFGIGTAFAILDRAFEKATEGSRKLTESVDNLKKAEAELAAVRLRIDRANRTPQENLSNDRLTLQGVEQRIAELEAIEHTVSSLRAVMKRAPNGDWVETGEFVTDERRVVRNAAQNNELAAMKKKQADLTAEIAKSEEAISREQDSQIASSNAKVEQFNKAKDEAAAKRLLAVNERLAKIGDQQLDAEFAKLTPAQQISQLLEEDARIKEEEAKLDLNNVAHLERVADLEARRLEIAKELEVSYRNAAAEVDRMLAKQLGDSGRAKSAIEADPRATDMAKRKQLIPILEQERDLIAARVIALEEEVALTTDPAAQKALEDRLERMRAMQAANAGDLLRAKPLSRLGQEEKAREELADPSKHYQTAGDGAQGGIIAFLTQAGTMADQLAAGIQNTLGAAVNGITQGIMGWVNGTMTFRQALANIGQSILQTMMQTIIQMGVQWLINAALVKTGLISIEATGDALRVARVAKENAAEAATLPMKTAGAAASGISSFGMTLAFGLLAVALIASLAGGFAEGGFTSAGGKYQPAGIVHAGEWVAPQWMVNDGSVGPLIEGLESMRTGGGIGAISRPGLAPGRGGASSAENPAETAMLRPTMIVLMDRNEAARMVQENSQAWFYDMADEWARKNA